MKKKKKPTLCYKCKTVHLTMFNAIPTVILNKLKVRRNLRCQTFYTTDTIFPYKYTGKYFFLTRCTKPNVFILFYFGGQGLTRQSN